MAIVCTVAPLNPSGLSRTTIRFSDDDDRRLSALDGEKVWPGIVRSPALNREGWNGDFSSGVFLPQAAVNIALATLKDALPGVPQHRWTGSPFRIYRGEPGDDWGDFELLFDGLVLGGGIEDGSLRLTAQVESEPFEAKVLSLEYDGRGGAGGVEDLAEKAKPMCFGNAENVEPVMINTVDNVFQVHGYGSIQGIRFLYERGVNFGPSLADYASYAALVAADIPEGQWATCLAEGMFRLGAPPYGLITADVSGDNVGGFHQTTAAVMRRLCDICDVDPGKLDEDSLDAFEDAVPYPINLYITDSVKLVDVLSMLALPCNANASLSWLGLLQVTRFGALPTPTITLDAQGRQLPAVLSNGEDSVRAPFHRIELQYARAWRVHSKDELALEDNLPVVPRAVWRQFHEQPETPVGNDIPAHWFPFRPELTRPYLTPDGKLMYGPAWVSQADQKGGETQDTGWSEPVMDDPNWSGFVFRGVRDSDLSLAGANSLRVDGNGWWDTRWITTPLAGPFMLRWFVKDADTRAVVGVMASDPANVGSGLNWSDIDIGVVHSPEEAAFGLPSPGIYPFNNGDFTSGYANALYNRSHGGVPSFSEYMLSCNGETVDVYVNREHVRTFVLDRAWFGLPFWPVFYLEGWNHSYGTDSDIFGIGWIPGTPARVLEFPVEEQKGAMRRMVAEDGWETNAPYYPSASLAGTLEAKAFRGGGRMDARVKINGSAGMSALELDDDGDPLCRVELSATGKYEIFVNGDEKAQGVFLDGAKWTIRYAGKRVYAYLNGLQIVKKKVGKNKTVTPRIEMTQQSSVYDIFVRPENEEEYVYKDSELATSFAGFTDASPQTLDGYTIIGTTADLAYTPDPTDEGDELLITATLLYSWPSGGVYTAPFYLPDCRVEYSVDGGTVWTPVSGTWTPTTPLGVVQGGSSETLTFTGTAIFVTTPGSVRARLVAKNTQTGTYNISVGGSSNVSIMWQA